MTDGNATVIDQVRKIVESGGKVPARMRDLILFSAIVEIYEKLDEYQPILVFYRVGMFFASALGLSVMALIWALLTGSVRLVVAGR